MADLRSLVQQATPGPWTWEEGTNEVKSPDGPVALVARTDANARLIALAPVLAQLVIDMADALEDLDPLEHSHAEIPALLARFAALGEETT